jgi:tellurite resistance protein TerC
MDWTIPLIILQLIVLEGLLSIDNAAVLGAMVINLPTDQEVPWPKALRPLGKLLHPLLGSQREAALRVGLLGAYLGRGLMLLLASLVVHNPWLKVIGAVYLVRLAFENLGLAEESDADTEIRRVKATSFWGVVLTVEIADLVFSLDNVVAAVSLSNQLWVVMLGVALGILFMRFAASLFSYAVEREPILHQAAYLLVFNIGVELLLEELAGLEISDTLRFSISIGTIVLALAYAHLKFLRVFRPVVIWVAQGFSKLNDVIDWALIPLAALLGLVKNALMALFTRPEPAVPEADLHHKNL